MQAQLIGKKQNVSSTDPKRRQEARKLCRGPAHRLPMERRMNAWPSCQGARMVTPMTLDAESMSRDEGRGSGSKIVTCRVGNPPPLCGTRTTFHTISAACMLTGVSQSRFHGLRYAHSFKSVHIKDHFSHVKYLNTSALNRICTTN